MPRTPTKPETLVWDLIEELRELDDRIEEGTIMGGRCARVSGEFLALVDYKGSGMVIKLPRDRVAELINEGDGLPFAPAGKVFREWVVIAKPDRHRWTELLLEAITFVAPATNVTVESQTRTITTHRRRSVTGLRYDR